MLRKKLTLILGIIAILAIMISACAPESTDAEMNDAATQEADGDLMVDDEMENEDDTDDSDNDSDDGSDDGMGDAGAEDGEDSGGEDLPAEMTDEEMLAFLEEKLEGEHTIDFILSQDKTYEEWEETFDNHINYGVELTDEERDMVINWLIERKASEMEEGAMEEDMAMTDDEMIALIESKIEGQHTLEFLLGQDKTYDEWVTTIDRMIGYGADVNDEEKELIINWLLEQ